MEQNVSEFDEEFIKNYDEGSIKGYFWSRCWIS